jgi:hypothetical protein
VPNLAGECAERVGLGWRVTKVIDDLATIEASRGQVAAGSRESAAIESRHKEAREAYQQAVHALEDHVARHGCDR